MEGQKIGYIRVSSPDQNPDRQLEGQFLDKKFIDYASAKTMDRPELRTLLSYAREGDRVIVHSLDRLARNMEDLMFIIKQLNGKGVVLQFIKEGLILNGNACPMSLLMLNVFGAIYEFERNLIRERQMEGIRLAKAKGLYRGSIHMLSPDKIRELQSRHALGITKARLCKDYGMSRPSVYKYLRMSEEKILELQNYLPPKK